MTALTIAKYHAPQNNSDEFALSLSVQPIYPDGKYTVGFRVSWATRARGGNFWGPDTGNDVFPDDDADFTTYSEAAALFGTLQKTLKTRGFTLVSVEHGSLIGE